MGGPRSGPHTRVGLSRPAKRRTYGGTMDGGTIIRRHRLALGWTQEDLAARAELSVRALRDIEQSRVSRPRVGSLEALANALHLSDQDRWELLDATSKPAGAAAPLYL